ncbi:hypothetical protein [Pseudomonas sp. zfem005]|uniref:hypothetical protein n=1 Tax=Pseudomonas sp. zfem005 TaxID=3078200 RepID=UPI002928B8AB|nr:hypothetical protein [Pseudomonas sp. zfem005]MDU9414510.1 hypothetical protein [Pseudomonas sp. zfem005]
MPWKPGLLLALVLSAGAAVAQPGADEPPPARVDPCTLKRDGAACSEQDPIFQQVMDELNRERRAAGAAQREKDRGERVP